MTRALLAVTVAVCGCSGPAGAPAKVWTPREFVKAADSLDFGGWTAGELAVAQGERLPFSTDVQGANDGLPVRPGVSEGRAVAYVITDVWRDHPEPWIQPVWHLATETTPAVRRDGFISVFPVDLDSTFYSPWWAQALVRVPDGVPQLTSARELLVYPTEKTGMLVLCTLVDPPTIGVASSDGTARHPLTGRRVWSPGVAEAFVEGSRVHYLDFGGERSPFAGQQLTEAELFVFVHDGAPVQAASVLPPDAEHHAFVRRVEVTLPSSARVFVPSNRSDLREALGNLAGAAVPALDGFTEYALRVAKSDACFTVTDFPNGCEWLDSQAKVRAALPAASFHVTTVQLVAATLNEVTP